MVFPDGMEFRGERAWPCSVTVKIAFFFLFFFFYRARDQVIHRTPYSGICLVRSQEQDV